MLTFKQYTSLNESRNTLGADINEILLGYYMLGEKWTGFFKASEVKKQLKARQEQVTEAEFEMRSGQAKAMAAETFKWATANGYKGAVKKAWWTARPGELGNAVGFDVDSRKNPTDTLVQFADKTYLGLSAKSTKQTKGDIGFKNPGIGTINRALDLSLNTIIEKAEKTFVKKWDLPAAKSARKKAIRAAKDTNTDSNVARTKLLSQLATAYLKKLKSMSPKKVKEYLLSDWMDVGDAVKPPYIKVTGNGKKEPFTATILDPLKNNKAALVQSNKKLELKKVGNDAVGVMVGGKRIMKMRFKYESQAMASSMKMSGDPWA